MNITDRVGRIIAQRQIVKSMTLKMLKDKYIGSTLGVAWVIINPVLMILAITFVFTQIMKTQIKDFPLLILSPLLPWLFFINSVSEATTSMKQNITVLSQFIITREIIPISVVTSNGVSFLFGFILILPVFVSFNKDVARCLVLLPLIMSLHFIFTVGVSLLVSIVAVYFKDLSQLLNVGTMFLFWVTPVFYSLEMIPPEYRWIILANPNTCYIVIYRSLLYYGSAGQIYMWLLAAGFSLVSIVIGYSVFIRKEADILKHI